MIFELEAWRQRLLDVINGATPHGGYGWDDPKDFGIPEDVTYLDKPWLQKFDPNGTATHCSGATLWAFCKTYKALVGEMTPMNSLSLMGMRHFQRLWYNAADNFKGPVDALLFADVGHVVVPEQIEGLEFAQLWRNDGSGHSVIVVDRTIKNLFYWSSNKAFNNNPAGMGFREEKLSHIKTLHVYSVGKDINTILT